MGFKGPKGQIQNQFSEELVYKACQLLLNNAVLKWQHKEQIETINSTIQDGKKNHKLSINWPLSKDMDEPIGSCDCGLNMPCVHLAALVIESKTRIDQLPPFTQQLQASQNIGETFSNWMAKQEYDPYPNMARHRLAYILDYDKAQGCFTIALHKAYISKEERYSLKSKLDSSLLTKLPIPKFVTLADQRILSLLQQRSIIKKHQFCLQENRDSELLNELLLTNRCFWRAVYRSPIAFDQNVNIVNPGSKKLINNYYFSLNENSIASKTQAHLQPTSIDVSRSKIIPRLSINSYEVCVQANINHYFHIDVAKVSFIHNNRTFTFADLSTGKIIPESNLLNQMAGYLRQIEHLDSVFAHFEQTVLTQFHLNDRYIDDDFATNACLFRGLQLDGWQVDISNNFRLNQIVAKDWYAQVKSHDNTRSASNLNNNWFDLELGVTIDGKPVNILPHLVKAINSGTLKENKGENFSIKLADGQNIGVSNNSLKQIVSTLTELYDEKSLNEDSQLTLSSSHLMRINQLQNSILESTDRSEDDRPTLVWQGDTWLKQKAEELNQSLGLTAIPSPKNLTVELRDYQKTGFAWLQFLSQYNLGGILADDMGLGKTLQILTHILQEKNSGKLQSPCLIVVPTSLLSNWQAEIQKFTPSLSSLVLTGTNRHKIYPNIGHVDIIIISYGVMIRDAKILADLNFHMHILDEAQAIKNAKTRAAKVASTIKANQRLCLSGTPIENHLGELWSLFNFLMPGFLGSQKQFEHIYQMPIEKEQDQDRQAELSKRVSPFMLRRTKSEVAKELPDKTEIVQIIELNEAQANLYETVRLTMSDEIKQAMRKTQGASNKIVISNALLRLRQICCHPALLKLDSITQGHDSAKLNWLTTVLPNMVEEGRRILLFSSFTSMLDIIQEHLNTLAIDSIMLTGKTPATKRGALIEKFQEGLVPVFLISLKAGGAGINLTTADTVIHFDPWWNPAAESQASDRAHRIGQNKNVFVYKLITKGTVEQKIQKLQKHKHALAQGIFDGQGNMTTVLNDGHWQDFLKPIE